MYPTKTGKIVDIQVAIHEARERQVRHTLGLDSEEVKKDPKEKAHQKKTEKRNKKSSYPSSLVFG